MSQTKVTKILHKLCLHFVRQDRQDGKKYQNTKNQKTKILDERNMKLKFFEIQFLKLYNFQGLEMKIARFLIQVKTMWIHLLILKLWTMMMNMKLKISDPGSCSRQVPILLKLTKRDVHRQQLYVIILLFYYIGANFRREVFCPPFNIMRLREVSKK